MKQLKVIPLFLCLCLFIVACKKGDTGPAGAQGPQGPVGIAGNANVTEYTFGATNLSTLVTTPFTITTTEDSMSRSAWFIYLAHSSGLVYPVPGFGYNGVSEYRAYWGFGSPTPGKMNLSINRVSGAGEQYSAIKVIRIYANTILPGGKGGGGLPDIDFNNYHTVCDYYKLPH